MSFRKRNVAVSRAPSTNVHKPNTSVPRSDSLPPNTISIPVATHPGVRSSPLTSHPTTSTGTPSLDKLLGLGAGLALGSLLLVQEDGSTDFASALLRAFAAEGVYQGHQVLVVAPKGWSAGLPGIAEEKKSSRAGKERGSEDDSVERLKIAWRYEKLATQAERNRRGGTDPTVQGDMEGVTARVPFCHIFDLARRLEPPPHSLPVMHVQPDASGLGALVAGKESLPFLPILTALRKSLAVRRSSNNSTQSSVVRLVIPTLLSPLLYHPSSAAPQYLIPFLHTLRSLGRQHNTQLIIMISWSLSLYPRSHILTRYAEHLVDGVVTLQPFPHSFSIDAIEQHLSNNSSSQRKAGIADNDEKIQGLLKVLRLPVLTERGISVGTGEDMAFGVSRRSFAIKPFHLPPLLESEPPEYAQDHSEGVPKDGVSKVDAKALDF